MSKDYQTKLRDPRWQRKRLEILERDEFTCGLCEDNGSELHVHHRQYHKGLDPWDYEDAELITLCRDCHEYVRLSQFLISEMLSYKTYNLVFNTVLAHLYRPDWRKYSDAIMEFNREYDRSNQSELVEAK
jgi:hypothetical protein